MPVADATSASGPVGVVLLNLGGPSDLASVEPFLYNLFSDREIIRLPGGVWGQRLLARIIARSRGPKVRENYRSIGGGSPILPLTLRQAAALEEALNGPEAARGSEPAFLVRIAMRYTEPTSGTALRELRAAGVRRVLALSLYPQYSAATTGSSWNELRRALRRLGGEAGSDRMHVTLIDRYPEHPGYLAALAGTVEEALGRLPEEERGSAVLLVSAHGLPVRFIERGDPYEREIRATRDGLRRRLEERGVANPWRLGYQSRTGPVKWLGPSTDEVLTELAREGTRAVVVIPVAFVSDHIETLHEIDQLFAEQARREGIPRFVRTRMLNDDPLFIAALAELVRAHLWEGNA